MNLQSEITELRARLGEPVRTDPSDGFFTDEELTEWIHQGELMTAKLLVEDALTDIGSESTVAVETTGAGTAVPTDFMRLLEVAVDSGWGFRRARLVSMEEFERYIHSPNFKGTKQFPIATLFQGKIYPHPFSGNSGSDLRIRYTKEPTRRHRRYKGQTDGPGTSTTLVDSSAPSTVGNDYFVAGEIRVTSGDFVGQDKVLSGYTAASGTFTVTVAYNAAPGSGIQFEAGQTSDLPNECWPIWINYAAFLALSKDRETQDANLWLSEFHKGIDGINRRYVNLHAAEPRREEAPA